MKTKTLAAKYSGDSSNPFWKRINKIKDETQQAVCYEFGCALQELEYRVLRVIQIAEEKNGG